MLKKRVIFTLLYNAGDFVLSRNFRLQKVGDLHWLQKNYDFSKIAFSIDELVILDISRGERDEDKFRQHVQSLTEECFVPISAGGGIKKLEQASQLLFSGADKVVLNSLVASDPNVISEIACQFGSQCVVISVDVKLVEGRYTVWTENGSKMEEEPLSEWLSRIIELPVGEVYINSIDRDGTGQGYDFEMLKEIPDHIPIPLILAGGAGKYPHLAEGLTDKRVDAVATAHLFNFVGSGLADAREKLLQNGYELASWDIERARSLRAT